MQTSVQARDVSADRALAGSYEPNAATWAAASSYTAAFTTPPPTRPGPRLPAQAQAPSARRPQPCAPTSAAARADLGQAAFEGKTTYGSEYVAKVAQHDALRASSRGAQHPVLPLQGTSTYAEAFKGAQGSRDVTTARGASAAPEALSTHARFEGNTEYVAKYEAKPVQVRSCKQRATWLERLYSCNDWPTMPCTRVVQVHNTEQLRVFLAQVARNRHRRSTNIDARNVQGCSSRHVHVGPPMGSLRTHGIVIGCDCTTTKRVWQLQEHAEQLRSAPAHPKVLFEGVSTYDDAFQGAQHVERELEVQQAACAHAPPDAPFESATEYTEVRRCSRARTYRTCCRHLCPAVLHVPQYLARQSPEMAVHAASGSREHLLVRGHAVVCMISDAGSASFLQQHDRN